MFNEDDQEEPATVLVTVNGNQNYDIKNLPGFKRKQLIESGQLSIDSFIKADNIPGYKLKLMRERFKANNGLVAGNKPEPTIDITKLSVGDLVSYKNTVTEVKEINLTKNSVYIDIKGKKKGWVNISKLKPVTIPPDNEDDE